MRGILLSGIAVAALCNCAAAANVARFQPTPPWVVARSHPFVAGVPVPEFAPDSAAARAGMQPGDRIVAIDGSPIGSYADLDRFVAYSGGRALTIDILRGGRRLRLRAAPPRMAMDHNGSPRASR
jgi:membrane-associated protease RseP (regulator of RpoE activity)